MLEKEVFTTYEVGKICHVDLTTVIGWIEKGILPGYRTPGGHRRVKKEDLLEFMEKYKFPLPAEWEQEKNEKRVLIIDDEPNIINFCVRSLKRLSQPIRIETAGDGFTGGKKISEFHPDLVILDLRLPGFDGFQLCQQIRKDEKYKKTKILAITAYDLPETKEKIIASGADAYLAKPFDMDDFIQSVEDLLGR